MIANTSNDVVRERAKYAVHNNLGRLIVMNLIQFALIIILMMIPIHIFYKDIVTALGLVSTYSYAFIAAYPMAVLSTLKPVLYTVGIIIAECIILLPWLIAGYQKALIEMARGGKPSIGTLFCRFRSFFGCIGLDLWVSLKLILWALPTIGLIYFVALIGVGTGTEPLMAIPAFLWLIPLLVLVIPASYRYAMAHSFYADDPSVGVFGAVTRSKEMMRCRKWQLFCLTFLYAFISNLVSNLNDMISEGLAASDSVVAMILGLVISLAALVITFYLTLRTEMSQACFYDAHRAPAE